MNDREAALARAALLSDPVRRRLFDALVADGGWLSRDQAAQRVGISRSLAAFHLDRLAHAGLAEVEHRRPEGRSGPGAGRPLKRYRRSATEVAVSLPSRRYDLAARILLRAAAGGNVAGAARDEGRAIAQGTSGDLLQVLDGLGYQPVQDGTSITLRNCPFKALTVTDTGTVCGITLALIDGVIEGAGVAAVAATDRTGGCCVRIDAA